ncbi:hypothetical protein OH76DRAFT_1424351, partial [Lentinus brumalis]
MEEAIVEQMQQDPAHAAQVSRESVPFFGTQHPFPTLSAPSYDLHHRFQMLEQEVMHLRQGHANLTAGHVHLTGEVAQLRSHPGPGSTGVSSQMGETSHICLTSRSSPHASSAHSDNLREALRQAVKPTTSLLPGEPLGFDCERSPDDFER